MNCSNRSEMSAFMFHEPNFFLPHPLPVLVFLSRMSGMISGGHNPVTVPGANPSPNDLASLIQA